MFLFQKTRKVVIGTMIVIGFLASFSLMFTGIQNEKLAEKFIDRQIDINLIARQTEMLIERDQDFEEFHDFYIDSLAYSIQILDNIPNVFAAMYDSNLNNISVRYPSYENSLFDPLQFPAFIDAIQNNQKGTIIINWGDKTHNISHRKVNICYQWALTSELANEPYLLVVGISKYSIKSPALSWFVGIILFVFSATFIVLFSFVIYIVRDIYIRFRGTK